MSALNGLGPEERRCSGAVQRTDRTGACEFASHAPRPAHAQCEYNSTQLDKYNRRCNVEQNKSAWQFEISTWPSSRRAATQPPRGEALIEHGQWLHQIANRAKHRLRIGVSSNKVKRLKTDKRWEGLEQEEEMRVEAVSRLLCTSLASVSQEKQITASRIGGVCPS